MCAGEGAWGNSLQCCMRQSKHKSIIFLKYILSLYIHYIHIYTSKPFRLACDLTLHVATQLVCPVPKIKKPSHFLWVSVPSWSVMSHPDITDHVTGQSLLSGLLITRYLDDSHHKLIALQLIIRYTISSYMIQNFLQVCIL